MSTHSTSAPVAQQDLPFGLPEAAAGVYLICCVPTGKVYVGSSATQIRKRWTVHRVDLRAGRHHNRYLQKAWDKYGEGAFEFVVIENCPPEECVGREQFWMNYYRSQGGRDHCYNICPFAGSVLGRVHGEETKAKMRAATAGRVYRSGWHHTTETRLRLSLPRTHRPPEELFWRHVNKSGPLHEGLGRCWLWTGWTHKNGRGIFTTGGRKVAAHRYAWSLRCGEIAPGLEVLHHCDCLLCVNPAHLYLGTSADRGTLMSRVRVNEGLRNGMTSMTDDRVLALRKKYKASAGLDGFAPLAAEFGISINSVMDLVKGRTWKHVSMFPLTEEEKKTANRAARRRASERR